MTIQPEEASTVKPLSPTRLVAVDAEAKVRDIVDKMIERAHRAARFDVEGGTHHDSSTLFSFAGNTALMFALHDMYMAKQQELREEARRGL